MNCKPGDLAVILWTRNYPENIGALVRVLHDSPNGPLPEYGHQWSVEPLQRVMTSIGKAGPGGEFSMPDRFLRPLRDNDGDDEMLRIAGKPEARPVFEFSEEQV